MSDIVKLVSPENFFWTDEDSTMIGTSSDTSNNRTPNDKWSIYDRIMDIIVKSFYVNRGEKTWKHIRGYKAIRIPFTNAEYTGREVIFAILSIIALYFSADKFRTLVLLLIIYNF